MTQYILEISSYAGIVPGARHYKGRVKGPHPQSCHGGTQFGATKSGKMECMEGHVLPDRLEWDVEAAWTEERHERWAAKGFEGDGPQQFLSKKDVIDRAIIQFLDGAGGPDRWWEQDVPAAEEGDELWHGWIAREGLDDENTDPEDSWGMCIARKCTT
jgi:hypothetical protein